MSLFISKFPSINISYSQDDLEYLKTLDSNINAMEDIVKCEDDIFVI